MTQILDLFGNPVLAPRNRGRPPHVPTRKNREKIKRMSRAGRTKIAMAAALGITKPTLRRHYFRKLSKKKSG